MVTTELREPLVGRLVQRGFSDEHRDRHYMIVDGTDGRVHYVDIGRGDATPSVPEGATIRLEPSRVKVSDMLLDGLRDPGGNVPVSTADWRVALRDGACAISLRGYSHVFAHGAPGEGQQVTDERLGVKRTQTGFQERYSPETLRAILRAYAQRQSPNDIRKAAIGDWSVPGGDSALPTTLVMVSSDVSASPPVQPEIVPSVPSGDDAIAALAEAPAAEGDDKSGLIGADTHLGRLIQRQLSADTGSADDQIWLEDVAQRCRNALLRYGMSARLDSQILTPNAALLKFKGSDELTVAAVQRRLTELETTHGLEVLTVRAEPGRVVISIMRPHRQVLTLPDVWKSWPIAHSVANTRLLLAVREEDGERLFLEPNVAPHSLVAGSTGSGKSVLVQNMLLGIAASNHPERAKIVLIDPKSGVDYFAFEDLPHLTDGIIDDTEAALAKLEWLVAEMERRYTLFKAARVSNIGSYNQKGETPLPTIWLVHDEFADWMQIDDYRTGVEAAVSRLGVKARAAGIYLIFAAQRPDASVFPMQLRSNLGNRLVLRVDSAGTSDLSLGIKGGGAERLLGKGHLAAILGGGTEPVYAQVPFVHEDDLPLYVEAIVQDLATR